MCSTLTSVGSPPQSADSFDIWYCDAIYGPKRKANCAQGVVTVGLPVSIAHFCSRVHRSTDLSRTEQKSKIKKTYRDAAVREWCPNCETSRYGVCLLCQRGEDVEQFPDSCTLLETCSVETSMEWECDCIRSMCTFKYEVFLDLKTFGNMSGQ